MECHRARIIFPSNALADAVAFSMSLCPYGDGFRRGISGSNERNQFAYVDHDLKDTPKHRRQLAALAERHNGTVERFM